MPTVSTTSTDDQLALDLDALPPILAATSRRLRGGLTPAGVPWRLWSVPGDGTTRVVVLGRGGGHLRWLRHAGRRGADCCGPHVTRGQAWAH